MKIKIIDLLNKIANDEEVPEKIKINNVIYEYRGYMYCTENANYQNIEDYLFGKWNFNILNDEVEIIEEPKKIEKIKMYQDEEGHYFLNKQDRKVYVNCDEIDFMVDKFNELIDEINNLKEKKDEKNKC